MAHLRNSFHRRIRRGRRRSVFKFARSLNAGITDRYVAREWSNSQIMTSSQKSGSTTNMKRVLVSKDGTIIGTSTNPKKMCLPPNTFLKSPRMVDITTLSAPMKIVRSSNLNTSRNNNDPHNDVNNEDGNIVVENGTIVVANDLIDETLPTDISIGDLTDAEFQNIEDGNFNRQEEAEEDETNPHRHNPAVCCSHCREERKRFEKLILRKLTTLLELNGEDDNRGAAQRLPNVSLLPPMPFNEINRLQQFDNGLRENERLREQFKAKIQDIGGKNLQKAVKFAMETVISDELCQKVVWVLGADNIPKISKFQFPYLIIDVIRSTFDGTKIKSVEDRMAEWIRRAGDRLKAATVAENKRREREQNQERAG